MKNKYIKLFENIDDAHIATDLDGIEDKSYDPKYYEHDFREYPNQGNENSEDDDNEYPNTKASSKLTLFYLGINPIPDEFRSSIPELIKLGLVSFNGSIFSIIDNDDYKTMEEAPSFRIYKYLFRLEYKYYEDGFGNMGPNGGGYNRELAFSSDDRHPSDEYVFNLMDAHALTNY